MRTLFATLMLMIVTVDVPTFQPMGELFEVLDMLARCRKAMER